MRQDLNVDVVRFINDNIDLIERGPWVVVFTAWMVFCQQEAIWPRDADFDDLIDTLESAGIKVDLDQREIVMLTAVHDLMEAAMKDRDNVNKFIGDTYIEESLDSHLGYTLDEIKDFMDKAAGMLGLVRAPMNNGYTW